MKKKMLSLIVTALSVVFMGHYAYHYIYLPNFKAGEKIPDTRTQITDQTDKMFRSTVLVNDKVVKESYGTGYVVSKNSVVTNRHVVMVHANAPHKLIIKVGHKDANGNVKFEEFEVEKITLPESENIDVAILTVKPHEDGKSVGDIADPVEFGDVSKIKEGSNINIVGYPGDKEYATLWHSSGPVTSKMETLLALGAITKPGNSGSPIFDDEGKLVAMNNAGDKNISYGFLIDDEIKKFIENNMK